MEKGSKIFVAGHQGLVGSAIFSNLKENGYHNLITRNRKELDLIDCTAVENFFKQEKPEYVFLAAAKVGGIIANNVYRGEFIYENLMIQTNVIHHSYLSKVKKLMFLGSTCIYPREAPQPIKEEYLLTGELEYTNEPYSIAKISGIKMCESYNLQYGTNFISVMPTNLYGPRDNFDLENSHVLPAIIRKVHLGKALEENDWEAIADDLNRRPIEGVDGSQSKQKMRQILEKYGVRYQDLTNDFREHEILPVEIEIWGSGKPIREFLWSEDMADACIHIMKKVDFQDIIAGKEFEQNQLSMVRNTHINIGTGREISIAHLAEIVKIIIKFKGNYYYNTSRPDGTMRKLTDVTRLNKLGWKYTVDLDEGIHRMYKWYLSSIYNFLRKHNRAS